MNFSFAGALVFAKTRPFKTVSSRKGIVLKILIEIKKRLNEVDRFVTDWILKKTILWKNTCHKIQCL